MNHYAEVPRQDDAPPSSNSNGMEVKTKMVPLDLEQVHNRQHRLEDLTLKIRFILPIIYLLVCFPLAFIMILISLARPVGDFSHRIGVLETIAYISQSNPVVDIQPITGSQVCMLNTFEPGKLGPWRGTHVGCYCEARNRMYKNICSPDDIEDGCKTVDSQDAAETFTWNGDRFCMRRLSNFRRTAGACPGGYTKCGTLFCTPTGESCPISDVKILKNTDPTPSGYTERPLTFDNKLVFISESTSDKQFAQFSYSTGAPCLDSTETAARTQHGLHFLEWETHKGCLNYGHDAESTQLDSSVTEDDFYLFNYVSEKAAKIPLYSDATSGSYVTISARYRFKTIAKDSCAQFYVYDVPELVKNVEDFKFLYRGISIAGMILTTITCFIAVVYIRVLKRDGFWMVFREETFGRRFIVQLVLLQTLFAIVTAILGNIALKKVDWQESYLKKIASAKCFQTQSQLNLAMDDVASYLSKRIDGLAFLNNLLLFISAATAGALLVLIVFRKFRGYERTYP